MACYLINKSALKGSLTTPSSKSQTLRAILFGSLGHGKSVIHSPLLSNDTQAMIEACKLFGAKLSVSHQRIEIQGIDGKVERTEDVIHAGNSGIALRFCSAIGALGKYPVVVTGDESIRHQRPMRPLIEALLKLGVSAVSMRGDHYAPLIIQGPIRYGKTTLPGEDSQPVSALLIASAFAEAPIEIEVENPGEKPWVSITLEWLDRLGIAYENHFFKRYHLFGNAKYEGFEYTVPGDFSSAAYPIAAALVTNSELTIKNIDMKDSQGDKKLITLFQKMGANIEIDEDCQTLHVKKGGSLSGLEVDLNDFIDAITILAVVACFAEGQTHIYNAAIAKYKECNRIHCIAAELKKMGADITETEEGLLINKSQLKGTMLSSYLDHRMAMSLAVAALGAEGKTKICNSESVLKTFPSFLSDFQNLGANIEEIP